MMRKWIVAAMALTAAGVAGTALAQTAVMEGRMEIDLAAMDVDRMPRDFASARTGQGDLGQWVVLVDPSSETGRALAQISRDRTDYRFPLAIYQPLSARNVDVTVRFKPVAGEVDQAAGIILRAAGADDYYVVRANALEDNVRFYRVVKGRRIQIAGANTKVASGVWHSLSLRAEGDRFTISYDGKQVFSARDATFSEPGRVGLWTKADSVTHFDRISITKLP
jgi:hypothetical protein